MLSSLVTTYPQTKVSISTPDSCSEVKSLVLI